MTKRSRRLFCAVAMLGLLFAGRPATAEDTIKIGYVDPFSGPFASGGDEFLKIFKVLIDRQNAKGGALGKKFELVPFDDKLQPAEALIALKNITDQNIPFVMQCTGSNVGAALIDGVAKHNARNPDNRVIYLNCGALATELTNEKCDFWQFRFAGNVEMRAAARIKSLPDVRQEGLSAEPGLPVRPIDPARYQEVVGKAASGHPDRRRRTDALRQGSGLLLLRYKDQGFRRAIA